MKRILLLLLLLVSEPTFAFLPAPGLWNNLAIDGQGFNIETQNNVMIVTAYLFDPSGNQIWYLAVGTYDEHNRTFSGTLANATNGSCLSCAYRAPAKNGNAGGLITIKFDSRESGIIFYPGGSRLISHFNYGYAGKTGYFHGEWQFSFNTSNSVTSQWLVFPGTTYTGSDGTVYASGYEDGRQSSTAALAYFEPSINEYLVAIDDGSGYQFFYDFVGDQQRMIGLGWKVLRGQTPSGNGSVAAGNRILVQSELANPVDALALPNDMRYESIASAIQKRTRDQ